MGICAGVGWTIGNFRVDALFCRDCGVQLGLEYRSQEFFKEKVSVIVDRLNLLQSHHPAWYEMVFVLQNIWVWSEVVVLLFNKRKRALHDFIAGTVVIHKEFERENGAGAVKDVINGDGGII